MAKRKLKYLWTIRVGSWSYRVIARTFGNAVYLVRKRLAAKSPEFKFPTTDHDTGGWKGVSGHAQEV